METKRTSKSFQLFVIISVLIIAVYSVCLTIFVSVLARDNQDLQTHATRLEQRLNSIEQIVKNPEISPSSSTKSADANPEVERLSKKVNNTKKIEVNFV